MDIAKAIQLIREEKRLTQYDVADQMGIERSNYARFEKRGDKLTIEQLQNIARALGVTIKDILFYGQPDNSEAVKHLENTVAELKQKLEKCTQDRELLRRDRDRYEQAFYKLTYSRPQILGEIISIIKTVTDTNQPLNYFELYWYQFIKHIRNDSAIMQAYKICSQVGMEEDFLDILLEDFYECMTAMDGITVEDAAEWQQILFENSDIDRVLDLTEQTKRKLEVKLYL